MFSIIDEATLLLNSTHMPLKTGDLVTPRFCDIILYKENILFKKTDILCYFEFNDVGIIASPPMTRYLLILSKGGLGWTTVGAIRRVVR